MGTIVAIIAFIIIFSALVLVHEWGHFAAARRNGIEVEEFGFGLPPRIWGKKKGKTLYSINWIPFGGFVRLRGEDSHDKKMLNDSKSFIAQSKWKRIQVVCAGVFMNFILAFVLLTLAFMIGTKPLIVDREELHQFLEDGTLETRTGLLIDEVREGSRADEYGFENGDQVVGFVPQGGTKKYDYIDDVISGRVGVYEVQRGKSDLINIEVTEPLDGLDFHAATYYMAAKVLDSSHQWLVNGTYWLDFDGRRAFGVEDIDSTVKAINEAGREAERFEAKIFADGKDVKIPVKGIDEVRFDGAYVTHVYEGTPASDAGLAEGNIIVRVEDEKIYTLDDLFRLAAERAGQTVDFQIITPELGFVSRSISIADNGKIGVGISQLLTVDMGLDGEILMYNEALPTTEFWKNEALPVHLAAWQSLSDMWRFGSMTATGFVGMLGTLLSSGQVSDDASGPVGIAYMTGLVVQEGFVALLVWAALLSLVLGVINILPIPALDGGRLLFIVIEAVSGKKVNQKWEAYIHGGGFLVLMLLIAVVTYKDIVRFFFS